MDQSPFAAPHGFSQRTTSFIASQRQGIHQMPLSRLIALISQCPAFPARLQETKTHPSSRWQRDHRHWKDQLQRFASPPVAGLPLPGPIAGSQLPGRACGQARPRHARDTCFSKHAPKPWHGKSNPFFTMSKITVGPKTIVANRRRSAKPVTFMGRESTDELEVRPPKGAWWSQTGSNRRPPACKAGALPTELWPRVRCPVRVSRQMSHPDPVIALPQNQFAGQWWAWVDSNYRPHAYQACALTT
jgi:hypothetical protein